MFFSPVNYSLTSYAINYDYSYLKIILCMWSIIYRILCSFLRNRVFHNYGRTQETELYFVSLIFLNYCNSCIFIIGEWKIIVTYAGEHIHGSPFTCYVYDPAKVKVCGHAICSA